MIFKNYYKILGLETNKVNIEEIKIAFREQAKKYHPDVNSGREAEERFKDINEAYRILSDTTSRRKYDRIWYYNVGRKIDKKNKAQERENRQDLLTLLFGINKQDKNEQKVNKKVAAKGDNVETEITLEIAEAFYGINKKISLRAVDGKMKNFSIQVPPGIRNGEKIRLIGQGKQGINGGKNGDLLIKINIQNNKRFRLQGYDIYTDLKLLPWQAVLGTRTKIETIDGDSNVYVPQGVGSGEKIRIQGKGYKDGKGGRGDLIAEIKIIVPKKPTDEELELYNKLKDISNIEPNEE